MSLTIFRLSGIVLGLSLAYACSSTRVGPATQVQSVKARFAVAKPFSVAVAPSGRVYFLSRWPSAAWVIAPREGHASRILVSPRDRDPESVAVSPGGTVWVSFRLPDPTGGLAYAQVLSNKKVLYHRVPNIQSNPFILAVGARSSVWFSTAGPSQNLGQMDERGRILRMLRLKATASALSADGAAIWFSEGGMNLARYDAATHAILRFPLPLSEATANISNIATDSSRRVWIASRSRQLLGYMDSRTGRYRFCAVPHARPFRQPYLSPTLSVWRGNALYADSEPGAPIKLISADCRILKRYGLPGSNFDITSLAIDVLKNTVWAVDVARGVLWRVSL